LSSDGKKYSQIDHLLICRRRQSSTRKVQSFRRANSETDHYLEFAELTDMLLVSKLISQTFDMPRFDLRKLKSAEVKVQYQVNISKRLWLWKAWMIVWLSLGLEESIKENINISARDCLGLYKLK
jgi:hypothetical protein